MDPLPILTGPTAVGKTDLSMDLAEDLNAEIISADSRQIYRELSIGTAKPDRDTLRHVRHHFIDERSLGEPYSAGIFHTEAYARISDILERGHVPLVVGGSTLYLHALKHGLAQIPPVPGSVRKRMRRRLETEGAEVLYDELLRVDPRAAATMDSTKSQRIIRALEVHETTGRTLSSYHDEQTPPPYSFRTVVLHRNRAQLYARINERTDAMLAQGLLDEVRRVLDAGHDLSVNPLRTIGYQEPIAFLRGEISRDEMVRLIKQNTRRYAKRQLTWFRRDSENVWIDGAQDAFALHREVLSTLKADQSD